MNKNSIYNRKGGYQENRVSGSGYQEISISGICVNPRLMKLKKQNQNRPSAGNPKHEALNPTTPVAWPDVCCPESFRKLFDGCVLKKQSQFLKG